MAYYVRVVPAAPRRCNNHFRCGNFTNNPKYSLCQQCYDAQQAATMCTRCGVNKRTKGGFCDSCDATVNGTHNNPTYSGKLGLKGHIPKPHQAPCQYVQLTPPQAQVVRVHVLGFPPGGF